MPAPEYHPDRGCPCSPGADFAECSTHGVVARGGTPEEQWAAVELREYKVEIQDYRGKRRGYDYGVFVGGKPAGRITERGELYAAYTNKRAPGAPGSMRGKFPTLSEAGAAVAEAHRKLS